MQQTKANFNLSWNAFDNYWICVVGSGNDDLHNLEKEFRYKGLNDIYCDDEYLAVQAPKDWKETWDFVADALGKNNFTNPKAAIIPDENHNPMPSEVMPSLESIEKINSIAKNLWLGDAMLNDRLECHFQPIIDRIGHIFGYEAFVRARLETGELLSGARVIQAARELNVLHLLDKKLHIKAIKTFAESKLPGNLFINFTSGFIQLPSIYLEGLSEAVHEYNILAKRIALDVSDSENVHDMNQISAVTSFCHSKNYLVALDDINSLQRLKEMLKNMLAKPDFIKLDRKIIKEYTSHRAMSEILSLVALAHEKGSMIIAEGIETEETFKALMGSGIDLFQGYFISQPLPIDEISEFKKAI